MKVFFRITLINVVFIFFLSFSAGFAADKKEYPTSPPAKIAKKWRVGYLEGGMYKDYPRVFTATVEGLAELGWIEKISIPREIKADTGKLWEWMTANIRSRYLQFIPDAYYSNQWDNELRKQNKAIILRRLNEKRDIDLMFALGTWAGQDLANSEHSVPTIICSVSDPLAAKIVKSVEDSGYDHVHTRLDPTRYERQVRAFHDIIGFKKLGVTFTDTLAGRSYASIETIEKVARERNFKVVECSVEAGNAEAQELSVIKCANELALKIDAYYISIKAAVNQRTLPKILDAMNAHNIPTFSQARVKYVRQGVLLSIANPSKTELGRFHAKVIARVINGAKPRDLNMVYEAPVKIAFNKATAKIIDLKDDIYQLLSETADEVYEEIEVSK
ncbi:ABC transporter substrate binding protein [Desulfococcaceae bacterium HSG8]|nr:ABC transporter substrate binding protein [Desulfococcaceae bacterium HSG8]